MKRFFYILLAALLLLSLAACQKAPEAAEPADEAPIGQSSSCSCADNSSASHFFNFISASALGSSSKATR